jgi:hypothetical protein
MLKDIRLFRRTEGKHPRRVSRTTFGKSISVLAVNATTSKGFIRSCDLNLLCHPFFSVSKKAGPELESDLNHSSKVWA